MLNCNVIIFPIIDKYVFKFLYDENRSNINDWNQNYEKITNMIVPRSSQLITTDQDYALFTVTLFKKVVAEFKHHARERKYVPTLKKTRY